jgi:hypothetical protein
MTARTVALRHRAWTLLRVKETASLNDLLAVLLDAGSAAQTERTTATNLQRYLTQLARAGYLAELRKNARLRHRDRPYVLTRNTGPLAPIPRFTQAQVFDPNQQVLYDITN